MKRLIITTIILIIATMAVTVVYFKNLNPRGQRTSQVMNAIPANATIIFEFNNDDGFYDIFNESQLFTAVIGKQNIADLDTMRRQLLLNSLLQPYFTGQNIFISIHPLKNNTLDFLITTSAGKGFNTTMLDELSKQQHSGLLITPIVIGGKKGYNIYSNLLKKRFYLINKEDDIFSGSFSKDLVTECAQSNTQKSTTNLTVLPNQQNTNALANVYVNYSQLPPLFDQLFANKNTDIFKSFRLFTGSSTLSLNFKNNALMFNGLTDVKKDEPANYLTLFADQQPVVNHLKDIFPSTTAYSINFAVSDPAKFKNELSAWQARAGLQHKKDSLFKQVKTETGINLIAEFNPILGNEFAVVTTRYHEKFGIITLKDGSRLKLLMNNISKLITENTGQLNYDKIPFFLLGDAFTIFKRPYFMIIDNYLILANSANELTSFNDTYVNRKFLSKTDQYTQFDNLLAERSNVAYFINFKNIAPLLKEELNGNFYNQFEAAEPGWKSFYALSYQFVATDKKFYTNFFMRLNKPDTTNIAR